MSYFEIVAVDFDFDNDPYQHLVELPGLYFALSENLKFCYKT